MVNYVYNSKKISKYIVHYVYIKTVKTVVHILTSS